MLIIDYQSSSYQRFLQDLKRHVSHPKRFLIIFNGANTTDLAKAMEDVETYSGKLLQLTSAIAEQETGVNDLFTEAKKSQSILLFTKADIALGKSVAVKNSHALEADFDLNNFFKNIANHKGMVILASEKAQTLSAALSSKVDVNLRFTSK
ncbi:AAA family ATPase [Psychromonas sp. MME2]|uniref:AAA family ATPase n=1 Tax=unclassified Psychromonas TaxID=2614957 RepID=UPI00339C5E57